MNKFFKNDTLRRMRMHGWFDILLLFLCIAVVLFVLYGIGSIQYYDTQTRLADLTQYEINQAMGFFASSKGTFLTVGTLLGGIGLLGMLALFVVESVHPSDTLQARRVGEIVMRVFQYAAAILISLIIIFPLYWMVISSLKTSDELLLAVPTLWPHEFQWANYPNVLSRAPFMKYLFNTLVSTFFLMLGELVLGVLAAYGFSKGEFKCKNALFIIVLGALMIPIQVTFVPIYVMVSRLGWINTFYGLVVPNLVSAYFIFMLRQTFMTVDNSYLEAGRVDGMGRIRAIFNVLCPMCAPTLITVSIITFINGWNSYFWPKMVAPLEVRRTIAVGVTQLRRTFAGMEVANYNEIMAGAVLAIIPIVVLFLILQKYIMTGMSKAAMK